MKKVFAFFLVVVVTLYAIARLTLEQPSDDTVHLRWATDPNPARKVQTERFGELQPGIEVSVESGNMGKLIVQCATGVGPDIIDVYNIQQMDGYVNAGLLLDLTPFAAELGFDPSRTYPQLRGALTSEGRQYRFPCNVWANCVVYNKAVFRDHGLPEPREGWTYGDFVQTAKEFNQPGKEGKTHIPVANLSREWLFSDIFFGHGGRFFTEDGLTSLLDSREAVAAMQLYHDLLYVHKVVPTPEAVAGMSSQGGWGTGPLNWFSSGRAAMMLIGRWYLNILVNYPETAKHVGAVTLPRVGDRPSSGVMGTRAAGINAKSPRWSEALAFLQYLASAEYGRLIVQDGDALPPNPELARSGEDLVNGTVNDPAFHQPFVDAIKNARPYDISPFIDDLLVMRWLNERIERVENNEHIDVAETMRDLAKEINLRIRRNIEREEHLRKKVETVTGKPFAAVH